MALGGADLLNNLLNNSQVRTKILLGFAFALVMMLLTTLTAFYNFSVMGSAADKIANDAVPIGRLVEEIGTELVSEESGIRGYIASGGDARFLETYTASRNNISVIMEKLAVYFPDYPELALMMVNEAQPNLDTIHRHFDSQIELVKSGKLQTARDKLEDGKAFMDVYGHVQRKLRHSVDQLANDKWNDSLQAGRSARWSMAALLVISVLVSVGIALLLARMIASRLQRCVTCLQHIAGGDLSVEALAITAKDEIGDLGLAINSMLENIKQIVGTVTAASRHVAEYSQTLSESAAQSSQASAQISDTMMEVAASSDLQMSTVAETNTIVAQISTGIDQVAANATQVAALSEQTYRAAKDGEGAVNEAIHQMSAVERTVEQSAQLVKQLGSRSQEIEAIVGTIAGISKQTNLLALNAAIEAARAGEQGRGFSVVAEEVRKLAEQSQGSAEQIAELIQSILRDTQQAVTAMDKGAQEVQKGAEVVYASGKSFIQISGLVEDVSTKITGTSTAVQQIAGGSQQMVSSMARVAEGSKESSAQAQTVSAATEEQLASMEELVVLGQNLSTMAQRLQHSIERFKL